MYYETDTDRGTTQDCVWVLSTGEWFSREMSTPDFDALMKRIAASCRVAEVYP